MTFYVLNTIAFDADGNWDPARNEWVCEDVGWLPFAESQDEHDLDCLRQFARQRYPKAFCIKAIL